MNQLFRWNGDVSGTTKSLLIAFWIFVFLGLWQFVAPAGVPGPIKCWHAWVELVTQYNLVGELFSAGRERSKPGWRRPRRRRSSQTVPPTTSASRTISPKSSGCRVGKDTGAAGRKHRLAGVVMRRQHGVGQAAAQRGHVGFGIQVAGVKDDEVGHGDLVVFRGEWPRWCNRRPARPAPPGWRARPAA